MKRKKTKINCAKNSVKRRSFISLDTDKKIDDRNVKIKLILV